MDELLKVMQKLDNTITSEEHQEIFLPVFKESNILFTFFGCNYWTAFTLLILQVITASPEKRIWPSTHPFPVEFLHRPKIYYGILIFQGLANSCHLTLSFALDTYGAALMNMLCGHITTLGKRIRTMDELQPNASESQKRASLIDYCKRYNLILRFG